MALSLALKAVSRSGLSSPASRATACHTTVARELLCWFAESYALRFEIEPNKPRFTFGIQEEEPSKPHSAPLAGYMNCICCLAHFELQNVWCSNHKENCRNNPEMTLYVLSLQIIRIKLKPKEHSNVSHSGKASEMGNNCHSFRFKDFGISWINHQLLLHVDSSQMNLKTIKSLPRKVCLL